MSKLGRLSFLRMRTLCPDLVRGVPLDARNWIRESTNRSTSVTEGWPSTHAKRVRDGVMMLLGMLLDLLLDMLALMIALMLAV